MKKIDNLELGTLKVFTGTLLLIVSCIVTILIEVYLIKMEVDVLVIMVLCCSFLVLFSYISYSIFESSFRSLFIGGKK